jgi:hypothetical protein
LALRANVYVQFANSSQRAQVLALLEKFNARYDGPGSFLGPELLAAAPAVSELRCYDDEGCTTAKTLQVALKPYLPSLAPVKDLSAGSIAKPTRGTIELWISSDEVVKQPT